MDTTLFILVFLFLVFSYLAIDDVQKRIINKLKSKPESELDKNFEKIKALEEQLEATLKELAALRAAVDGPSTALVVWRPQRRA